MLWGEKVNHIFLMPTTVMNGVLHVYVIYAQPHISYVNYSYEWCLACVGLLCSTKTPFSTCENTSCLGGNCEL